MDLLKFATQTHTETVEITLPAGCKLSNPAYAWQRGTGGKIIVTYSRDQLLAALVAADWLDPGSDQLSLQGLALYARLRIGEDLIATATDGRQDKLIEHWCQIWAELAIVEPDLVGGGHGQDYWQRWAQEVVDR